MADFCGVAGVFSMLVGGVAVVVVVVGSVVLAWEEEAGWSVGRLTLVVVDDIAEMVAAGVVGLPHAHGVVREVDIAIVAKDWMTRGKGVALAWKTRRGRGGKGLTLWHFGLAAVTRAIGIRTPRLIGILSICGLSPLVVECGDELDVFKGSDGMANGKIRAKVARLKQLEPVQRGWGLRG